MREERCIQAGELFGVLKGCGLAESVKVEGRMLPIENDGMGERMGRQSVSEVEMRRAKMNGAHNGMFRGWR